VQHAGAFERERDGGNLSIHNLNYRSQLFSMFRSSQIAFLFNWLKNGGGGIRGGLSVTRC
jgi:hypothetical protein